jgi:acetolactate synthase-1/2/3 large subunit
MNEQELALLANYHIPVKIIIFNNGFLGMVRQWQEMFHDKRYSGTCLSRETDCPLECDGKECREYFPNFVKLADAFGIPGFRVTHAKEMDEVLTKALLEKGPVLIEVVIPREENVMPMVPPGKANEDLIESAEVKK